MSGFYEQHDPLQEPFHACFVGGGHRAALTKYDFPPSAFVLDLFKQNENTHHYNTFLMICTN